MATAAGKQGLAFFTWQTYIEMEMMARHITLKANSIQVLTCLVSHR